MLKALNALKVVSAAAITVAFIPLAAPSSAVTCDDVQFIFARGSGQSLGDKEYNAYKASISAELTRANSELKYSFYELGSAPHGGYAYPAVGINFFTSIGAKVSAGKSFTYGNSVDAGINELKSYIREISSTCKNTKFVLGGYSQGAQVITMAADELDSSKIIYSATFGDPKLYLPEGEGVYPDACRGKNLSPYREYAPNCRTSAGSLDAKKPYQTSSWTGKKGLWCKDKDIICGAGLDLTKGEGDNLIEKIASSAISAHVSYVTDGVVASAAKTIVQKLQAAYPTKLGRANSTALNRDTAILIDRTASMSKLINRYKREALNLAQKTLLGGGRVALYTYGDLGEGQYPENLVSFGETYTTFQIALEDIYVGGGGDDPESMLSAIYTVMSEQKWRAGATKSIVVLTDAGYHNPDIDGTTISDIIRKSYEIDPVNVYVISEETELKSDFEQVATPTGGQVFDNTDSISTDLLTSRPNVTLPLAEYVGGPGEEFTFTATTSDNVVSYSWDLDFDGVFETTTASPTITKSFDTVGYGYITVKATDVNGYTGTTSAKIIITNNMTEPEISDLKLVDQSGNKATLSYALSNGAALAQVAINDTPVGFTDQNTLEITDLNGPTTITITLTPISDTGQTGEPVSIKITTYLKSTQSNNDSTESGNGESPEEDLNAASSSTDTNISAISSSSRESVQIIRILAPNSGKK